MTLHLTYGEAVALAAVLSLSRTALAARLTARLDEQISAERRTEPAADKATQEGEMLDYA